MRGKWYALLALPFVLVLAWTRLRVAAWGDGVARDLGEVASLVPSSAPPASDAGVPLGSDDGGLGLSSDASPSQGLPLDGGAASALRKAVVTSASIDAGAEAKLAPVEATRVHGGRLAVRVPVDAVARAMDAAGSSMHARTTRDAQGHPAGVKLTGVNAAHIGLQDGDVIVSVDGKPTKDDDRATEIALAVIGRGDSTLRAVVMRGDTLIDVTLDLPMADAGAAP